MDRQTEHYRKLERMYLQANVNTQLFESTTIRIAKGEAEIGLRVSEKYYHALGAMHGAVYFKLLDDAAFFAVASEVEEVFVLTTSFNLHFVRPVKEGLLRAEGKVRFTSRQLYIAEASLYNEAGKEVAFGTGHFGKTRIPLSPDIGYE